jgi:hypothetical protein
MSNDDPWSNASKLPLAANQYAATPVITSARVMYEKTLATKERDTALLSTLIVWSLKLFGKFIACKIVRRR